MAQVSFIWLLGDQINVLQDTQRIRSGNGYASNTYFRSIPQQPQPHMVYVVKTRS